MRGRDVSCVEPPVRPFWRGSSCEPLYQGKIPSKQETVQGTGGISAGNLVYISGHVCLAGEIQVQTYGVDGEAACYPLAGI